MGLREAKEWVEENNVWVSIGLTLALFVAGRITSIANWIIDKPQDWFFSVVQGLSEEGVAVPDSAAWLIAITSVVFPIYFVYYHRKAIGGFFIHIVNYRHKLGDRKDE